jgi:hypothetical protein
MKRLRSWITFAGLASVGLWPLASGATLTARAAPASPHMALNCEYSSTCAEVANPDGVFDTTYVGHDEPSLVFYSNTPGSGSRMSYDVTLPRDPSPNNPTTPGKSYQFQLNGALWFGLAMCDTQSYPEQVSTCTPNSDSNIVDPAVSPNHPGTAFMEMQFYPPGWVPWPTWAVAVGASACDATKWCAAINIFSLSQDPVNGTVQNDTCANLTGIEYVNFAFITRNGRAHAPANPVDSTLATFTPDPEKDLFMNSGDRLKVSFADTENGLRVVVNDLTAHQSGSMTASKANGFAQVKYDPKGTSCDAIPYDFHPMYSTSSEQTRVIWAAHTYNVSFSDEIGHFENCEGPNPIPATPFGLDGLGNIVRCPAGNTEGFGAKVKPKDRDDTWCFPASEALRIHINGCTGTNSGFDGLDYQPVWPDGNTQLHPEPILFSSPLTGEDYDVNYQRVAFEADLPRIESGRCNRTTGDGCTRIPIDDAGNPVAFYPFFSTVGGGSEDSASRSNGENDHATRCLWGFGNDLPGGTNNFGRQAQWGSLLLTTYLAGNGTINRYNNFRQVLSTNPCPAQSER